MTNKISFLYLFSITLCIFTLTGCGIKQQKMSATGDVNMTGSSGEFGVISTDSVSTGSDQNVEVFTDTSVYTEVSLKDKKVTNPELITDKKINNELIITEKDINNTNIKTFTSKKTFYKIPTNEKVNITIIAKVDVETKTILGITVQNESTDTKTAGYQKAFNDKIGSVVIGKKLDNAYVSKLNGSSLTSVAFNNAIDDIKSQI